MILKSRIYNLNMINTVKNVMGSIVNIADLLSLHNIVLLVNKTNINIKYAQNAHIWDKKITKISAIISKLIEHIIKYFDIIYFYHHVF